LGDGDNPLDDAPSGGGVRRLRRAPPDRHLHNPLLPAHDQAPSGLRSGIGGDIRRPFDSSVLLRLTLAPLARFRSPPLLLCRLLPSPALVWRSFGGDIPWKLSLPRRGEKVFPSRSFGQIPIKADLLDREKLSFDLSDTSADPRNIDAASRDHRSREGARTFHAVRIESKTLGQTTKNGRGKKGSM